MENKLLPSSFETLFAEKCDIENESEHILPEYMQNISRIVKTDAKMKITDKNVSDNSVEIIGEIVYTVLYSSENSGLLKSVIFSEEFRREFGIKPSCCGNCEVYVSVKAVPVNALSKLHGPRKISSRSKFSLYCEIYDIGSQTYCVDAEAPAECGMEYLKKNTEQAALKVFDGIRHNISESFEIDSDMPEISDIIDICGNVCIKNISRSDSLCEVTAELGLICLYETKTDDSSEYVSLEKNIPFRFDVPTEAIDSSWSTLGSIELVSVSADSSSDNFGEHRLIDISASFDILIIAAINTECTVLEDIYSTECNIFPEKKNVRIYTLAGTFGDIIEHTERVRMELRGISDIVSSSFKAVFSAPEFADGGVFVTTRGILNVLGIKENGDIDSQSCPVNMRIPISDITPEMFEKKLKWLDHSSVCRHECTLSGGELLLNVVMSMNCAAFCENTLSIVADYKKENDEIKNKKCGFTLYYPAPGESVWNVAKEHGVSCERLCAENGIDGEIFKNTKAIVLR